MFLDGNLWDQSCDNSYTWNLSMLAVALYWLTRLVLVKIDGLPRRPGLPSGTSVVHLKDLAFADRGADA